MAGNQPAEAGFAWRHLEVEALRETPSKPPRTAC